MTGDLKTVHLNTVFTLCGFIIQEENWQVLMGAYLLLERLLSLNISGSPEESNCFCSRFMQIFIYIQNGKSTSRGLEGSLSFTLSVVCAYLLLLVTFRFFILSCRSKSTVVRLNIEKLNALEI